MALVMDVSQCVVLRGEGKRPATLEDDEARGAVEGQSSSCRGCRCMSAHSTIVDSCMSARLHDSFVCMSAHMYDTQVTQGS